MRPSLRPVPHVTEAHRPISINVIGTLALYLLLNQRIIKGLTDGSVKG